MTSSAPGIELLLDTNIIIYLTHGDQTVARFMDERSDMLFAVSALSYLETLMGIGGPEEEEVLDAVLKPFVIIPVTATIARTTANALRTREKRSVRDPLFADAIIANTALELGVPLVTNNPKDFGKFKGLKILTPKQLH